MDNVVYETETCTRCGGSGTFSFNQITGPRCFKCNGNKVVYTKRGEAARAYANKLRTLPVSDIEVGQRIYWGRGGRCTVTAIDAPKRTGKRLVEDGPPVDLYSITVHGRGGLSIAFDASAIVRVEWTLDMIKDVMEYQASLTKSGAKRRT
jgi:hypothetical protein